LPRSLILPFFVLLALAFSGCNPDIKWCADSKQKPLRDITGSTHVEDYIRESNWNDFFPNRYGIGKAIVPGNNVTPRGDFYSFHAFLLAAAKFPKFAGEGSTGARKRELAAFLANMAQQTSGEQADAPGEHFKWGLYYIAQKGCENGCIAYTDTANKKYPPVNNVSYHGRAAAQISWNYNYGKFSEAYFGSKDTLLQHPDLLIQDPVLSFSSAIWLWMTPQGGRPSCHEIMTGKWKPTADDIAKGRKPGFGATLNAINGSVECGITPVEKTKYRYQYYRYFCQVLNVVPGKNIECTDQKPFGQ
jgi:hypothetical protein